MQRHGLIVSLLAIALIALIMSGIWVSKNQPQTQKVQTADQYKYHNPEDYIQTLSNNLWYLDPKLRAKIDNYLTADESKQTKEWIEEKHEFFQVIGDLLKEGKIKTASSGKDMDEQRMPIDTIVVHHTQTSPERNTTWLNGLQMLTLYVPTFSDPKSDYYEMPLWSGHFEEDSTPIFIAYHYLVWPDGRVEQPLEDNEIGWHAGIWDVNTRSIGIAFVEDLTESKPSDKAIESARNIISRYKAQNPNIKVVGHKELQPGHTACPGNKFEEWKEKLTHFLQNTHPKLTLQG